MVRSGNEQLVNRLASQIAKLPINVNKSNRLNNQKATINRKKLSLAFTKITKGRLIKAYSYSFVK